MNDDQLHRLLRAHPARAVLKNSFNHSVWTRIEAEEAGSCHVCVRRLCAAFFTWIGRPVPAAMTLAASIALGFWLGSPEDPGGHPSRSEIGYIESIPPVRLERASRLP